jgi:hypothetical protein
MDQNMALELLERKSGRCPSVSAGPRRSPSRAGGLWLECASLSRRKITHQEAADSRPDYRPCAPTDRGWCRYCR